MLDILIVLLIAIGVLVAGITWAYSMGYTFDCVPFPNGSRKADKIPDTEQERVVMVHRQPEERSFVMSKGRTYRVEIWGGGGGGGPGESEDGGEGDYVQIDAFKCIEDVRCIVSAGKAGVGRSTPGEGLEANTTPFTFYGSFDASAISGSVPMTKVRLTGTVVQITSLKSRLKVGDTVVNAAGLESGTLVQAIQGDYVYLSGNGWTGRPPTGSNERFYFTVNPASVLDLYVGGSTTFIFEPVQGGLLPEILQYDASGGSPGENGGKGTGSDRNVHEIYGKGGEAGGGDGNAGAVVIHIQP